MSLDTHPGRVRVFDAFLRESIIALSQETEAMRFLRRNSDEISRQYADMLAEQERELQPNLIPPKA